MSQGELPVDNVILAEVVEPAEHVPPTPWGFWATLGLSLAVMIAFIAAQSAVVIGFMAVQSIQNPTAGRHNVDEFAINGLCLSLSTWVSSPACLALIILFVKLRKRWSICDYLALNRIPMRCLIQWALVLLAFVVVTDGLTWFLGRDIVPAVMVEAYRTADSVLLLWATLCVAAPVFEEVFFRGFIFRGLQASRLGNPGAVLITALAWSMMHLQYDIYQLSVVLAGGILLGIVRVRSNSTSLTIALHSLMNVIATIELEVYLWLHSGQ